ncbi:hypothetical protein [Arachidicoccus terrestris]|uniref:hypothetical protein n=1 Tax=Arachidicoccus terrestris TaxID=2875539 RepID=UPI001CC7C5A8|nr:hypothetical protein [Arachidicoccus terrestris]UAY56980.1 hypothetical protein K9M52_08330 [Arachidicoccus terrestris]
MSEQKLKTQIKLLTISLVVISVAFGALFVWLYAKTQKMSPDEITVKKLNLIGEDGTLRMVLSNETRQNSGVIDGKQLPPRERPAGMIFFDNNGNECGGLVFQEARQGETINKMMSFTMDNYRNDQVLQLINDETYKNGHARVRRGMAINEYPVGRNLLAFAKNLENIRLIKDTAARQRALDSLRQKDGPRRRLFIGRTNENQSGIFLFDNDGRPRMQIFVDSVGAPQILAIDTAGKSRKMIDV